MSHVKVIAKATDNQYVVLIGRSYINLDSRLTVVIHSSGIALCERQLLKEGEIYYTEKMHDKSIAKKIGLEEYLIDAYGKDLYVIGTFTDIKAALYKALEEGHNYDC